MFLESLRTPRSFFTPVRSLKFAAAVAAAAAAFALLAAPPLPAQAVSSLVTNRLTQPVDESARITLKGTVHPLAVAANDRGAASDSMPLDRIQVTLKRSDAQEAALKQLLAEMHTPGKPGYHKWLTPDQFGQQFGASDQDIATVEAWLQSKGFSVTKVNPGKQTLEIAGNVAQFRTAFHTQIRKYSINGQTRYSNANDPQIPTALAPVLGGFSSLNNFPLKSSAKNLGKANYDPKTSKVTPQWTRTGGTYPYFALSPGDYAVQYDLNPLYTAGVTGSGQTIAIVNESNINIGLVNSFRTLFGLPANPPQVIIDGNDPGVDGNNNPYGPNGASIEAYLDVEWAGAVAPAATIDLVIAADTALQSGLTLAAERAVYSNIAPIISLSFGQCEKNATTDNAFFNNLWEQAAAQGITVMVSAGDNGSAGCDNDDTQDYAVGGQAINGLGSTPYDVAVGGTDFYYSSYNQGSTAITAQLGTYWNTTPSDTPTVSINGVIPEQPWNESQYGLNVLNFYTDNGYTTMAAGSGGASTCGLYSLNTTTDTSTCAPYPKPVWQAGLGVPADSARDIPDVSLFASSGANLSFYPECYQDGDCQPAASGTEVQITGVGGTSAAAPSFAGIMALVNQKYGRQGLANYVLYPLATQFPASFHDVTVGTNSVPCAFNPATPGCIAVTSPITDDDPTYGTAIEGQIGTGATPLYNATAGYDPATGLGTVDANQLVTNWASVTFAASTVTLTSPTAAATFTHGSPVTFTGAVEATGSNIATGNVAIETDSTEVSQQGITFLPLSAGAFNGAVSTLPGGTYNVWANYAGDTANAANASAKTQITVSPEASAVDFNIVSGSGTIATGTATVDYGTQALFSAQPTPATQLTALQNCQTANTTCPTFTSPTGTVAFADSGAALSTSVLNREGEAELNAALGVGAHSITASYAGDQSYAASASAPITLTVVKDTPAIGLSAANQDSDGDYLNGQPTVFNIQVANGAAISYYNNTDGFAYKTPVAPPTGTITISGFPGGTSAVSALSSASEYHSYAPEAVATVTAPASASGNYNVTINYSGDANYNATTSTQQVSVLSPGGSTSTTTATITGSVSPATSVTISGTVTGQSGKAAPTGGILLYISGNYIGNGIALGAPTSDVSPFSIVLNSQNLPQGANVITLQYTGDTVYAPSAFQVANPIVNSLSDFSLVPEAAIISIPAAAAVTENIDLASTNGFAGAVNLTCASTGGVICSLGSTAPTLTAGGAASVVLTLSNNNVLTPGSYNALITGTDSTGAYVHTAAIAVVVASATALPPGLTVAGPASIVIQNPGATATVPITVAAQGGLIGVTSFTCAITGAPAGITCAAPNTAANGTTSTLSIVTTSAAAQGSYTAEVTATQGTVTSAPLSIPVTVDATAAIALTNNGPVTATPGTPVTATITVTPAGSFAGNVTLTCSLTTSPTGAAQLPTCSIPSTLAVTASTPATATLTISSTAATTSALERPLDKLFAVGGGIAVAGLLLFTIPARRRSWRSILGVLVFAAFVGLGIGCGGGGNSGGGGGGTTPGTTAGAYVFTVTGVDAATGAITGSTPVNVTVN